MLSAAGKEPGEKVRGPGERGDDEGRKRAGDTERTADAQGSSEDRRRHASSSEKARAVKTRQG